MIIASGSSELPNTFIKHGSLGKGFLMGSLSVESFVLGFYMK